MNTKLLKRVKDAILNQENKIKLAGYNGLSRSDLEMVMYCVENDQPLNYAAAMVEKLYNDIVK